MKFQEMFKHTKKHRKVEGTHNNWNEILNYNIKNYI